MNLILSQNCDRCYLFYILIIWYLVGRNGSGKSNFFYGEYWTDGVTCFVVVLIWDIV